MCQRELSEKSLLAWYGDLSGSATCCTVNPSLIVVSLPTMSSTSDVLPYSKRPEWRNITPIPQHESLGPLAPFSTPMSVRLVLRISKRPIEHRLPAVQIGTAPTISVECLKQGK